MADSPYRVGYDIRAKVDYSQIKDATKAAGELINKLQKVQDLQKGRTAGSTGDSMKSAMRSTAQETQNVTNKAKTAAEAQAKLADQMKKTANSGKSMKSTAENVQSPRLKTLAPNHFRPFLITFGDSVRLLRQLGRSLTA
ncbi:hypothetical protein [Lentilactobacillus parabuchneri]|uniref:hypothetical protein n=1 Tax=Lentilactobacillus parabuchneri TaxID=152331 RepID=UPI000A0F5BE5|nr:hypothetical protein FAM23167_02253 [Lentilactobacillus parabuchneri]